MAKNHQKNENWPQNVKQNRLRIEDKEKYIFLKVLSLKDDFFGGSPLRKLFNNKFAKRQANTSTTK
jgi:hypothetical protein